MGLIRILIEAGLFSGFMSGVTRHAGMNSKEFIEASVKNPALRSALKTYFWVGDKMVDESSKYIVKIKEVKYLKDIKNKFVGDEKK